MKAEHALLYICSVIILIGVIDFIVHIFKGPKK
jgi:hypothetical protein